MKTFILAALVAASAAPAAFAATSSQLLSNSDRIEIKRIVPTADLSDLTVAEAGALAAVLSGDGRGDNPGAQIRAILGGASPVDASRAAAMADAPYVAGGKSRGSDH